MTHSRCKNCDVTPLRQSEAFTFCPLTSSTTPPAGFSIADFIARILYLLGFMAFRGSLG